ncbi:hypothetical protein [Kitasatospora sp. MBT63]|uniref:hypothetical protein n=1 Tax=Kitasatospora sp. MBT63 TaxID=1444768 RepID=UPI0011EA6C71|nr:hypothetical protein [Kitasatospora sp. MBT63]
MDAADPRPYALSRLLAVARCPNGLRVALSESAETAGGRICSVRAEHLATHLPDAITYLRTTAIGVAIRSDDRAALLAFPGTDCAERAACHLHRDRVLNLALQLEDRGLLVTITPVPDCPEPLPAREAARELALAAGRPRGGATRRSGSPPDG